LGNLYIVDGSREGWQCSNNRLLEFDKESLIPHPSKNFFANNDPDRRYPKRVYGGSGFQGDKNAYRAGDKPFTPMGVGFNKNNQMIITADGYGNLLNKRVFKYDNPLPVCNSPCRVEPNLTIPVAGAQLSNPTFDSEDNLIILDHTWNRVLFFDQPLGIPAPTLTPTPACPAGCTTTETRQSAIEKYCKNEGFSCNNGVWADLTCYGGQNSEGCQWVKFKDGPICKDPYCAGCSCITSTPAPPLKKCAEIAADAGVNYSLCSTDFSTGFYCGSTAAICYSQIRVADSSDCVGGQKCRYYNREICNGCDTTKCTVNGCINPAVLPCPIGNPAKNEGNANCDEKIDNADFVVWRGEFLWEEKDVYTADLNGDNKIDGVDFEIWRENRN